MSSERNDQIQNNWGTKDKGTSRDKERHYEKREAKKGNMRADRQPGIASRRNQPKRGKGGKGTWDGRGEIIDTLKGTDGESATDEDGSETGENEEASDEDEKRK